MAIVGSSAPAVVSCAASACPIVQMKPAVAARSKDGVLEIVIPKQPAQVAKTIKVKAA